MLFRLDMNDDNYLTATHYCDSDAPSIQEVARSLTYGCRDDRERAIAVFEWVQDEIPYRIFHDWGQTASETLAMRGGACTNKANLYVAFMRAIGIPAGFHVLVVNGQHYFGPVWVPTVSRLCSEVSVHIHAAVQLDGQWLRCDPTDDIGITHGTAHVNPPSERVVFDGRTDAVLNLDSTYVYKQSECLPDIDHLLQKRSEKPALFFRVMDLYLEFGRRIGAQYDLDTCEDAFRAWMGREFPDEYAEFCSLEAELFGTR